MGIFITLLTFVLILTCVILILLVLIQLPKKETGAGVAFGAGATDALFGAGSGNVLTKVTKYAAGFFLGLSMLLSVLNINYANSRRSTDTLKKELEKASRVPIAAPTQPLPLAPAAPLPAGTNLINSFEPVTVPGAAPVQPAAPVAPAPAEPKKP